MKSVFCDDLFHLLQVLGDFQIGMVMRFPGSPDQEKLLLALREILSAFPVLGSVFVPGWRRGRWEQRRWNEEQFLTVAAADRPEERIQSFFTSPVDPYTGPQIKCLLLSGDRSYLCLNVSHFVADAAGVKELAYLLLRAYRSPGSIRPKRHERGLDILWRQLTGWGKLAVLKRTIEDLAGQLPLPPSATLPSEGAEGFARRYVIHALGPETTLSLKSLAVRFRATTNDVLMAAFLRSLALSAPSAGRTAFRLVVTADLRRHLPAGQQTGQVRNLSGWVLTGLGRNPGRSLEETCRKISTRMDRLKDGCLGLGMLPPAWLAVRGLPSAIARAGIKKIVPQLLQRVPVAPSFTNMGRIDPRALDLDGRSPDEAYLLAPVVYAPVLGVGVSRYRDTITLSAGFNVPGFNVHDVTALLAGIEAEII